MITKLFGVVVIKIRKERRFTKPLTNEQKEYLTALTLTSKKLQNQEGYKKQNIKKCCQKIIKKCKLSVECLIDSE